MRRSTVLGAMLTLAFAFAIGCGGAGDDDGTTDTGETSTGDGDSGDGDPGDGDGDPGDGDGDPGDGDGDPGDGDGDPGDGDGDPGCDPSAFVGVGIADDPWAQGSFCDSIYVCVDDQAAQDLMTALDGVQCLPNEGGCGDALRCEIGQGDVSPMTVLDACVALSISGIDEVYCIVYA